MFQVNHMKTRLSVQSRNIADMLSRKACRTAFRLTGKEKTGSVPSLCLSYIQSLKSQDFNLCLTFKRQHLSTLQDSRVKKLVKHFQEAKKPNTQNPNPTTTGNKGLVLVFSCQMEM